MKPYNNLNTVLIDEVDHTYFILNQIVLLINNLPDRDSSLANSLRRECRVLLLDTSLWLSLANNDDRNKIRNRLWNQSNAVLKAIDNSLKQAGFTPNSIDILRRLRGVLVELLYVYKK